MAEFVAIDVEGWSEEDGMPTWLHLVLCERHYNIWAMEGDALWRMCDVDSPIHQMQDYCNSCDMEETRHGIRQ